MAPRILRMNPTIRELDGANDADVATGTSSFSPWLPLWRYWSFGRSDWRAYQHHRDESVQNAAQHSQQQKEGRMAAEWSFHQAEF